MNNSTDQRSLKGEAPKPRRNSASQPSSTKPLAPIQRRDVADHSSMDAETLSLLQAQTRTGHDKWLHIPEELAESIGLHQAIVGARLCQMMHSRDLTLFDFGQGPSPAMFIPNDELLKLFPFLETEQMLDALDGLLHQKLIDYDIVRGDSGGVVLGIRKGFLWYWDNWHTVVLFNAPKPPARKRKKHGFVYLLHGGGYYKIGKTTNLDSRHIAIGRQVPFEIELIHAIETSDISGLERYWHRRFKPGRGRGEWFTLSAEEVTEFCVQNTMDVPVQLPRIMADSEKPIGQAG
jgi:Meiotically up-regulated gene 113